MDASPATIRRDLNALEARNLIIRTHGFIHRPDSVESILPVTSRSLIASVEKARIGQMAAELVEDGMTLILDSGTTTLELARCLKDRHITVVTNSIDICQVLADSEATVICVGGMLEKDHLCFLGRDAIRFIERIEVDLAFLGATGVRKTVGLTTSSPLQFDYKRAVLTVSKRKIALFDTKKFTAANLYVFTEFKELDMVISNRPEPASEEEALFGVLAAAGTEIILA